MSTKFLLTQNSPQGQASNSLAPADAEYVFDGSMFTIGSDEANNIVLAGSASEQAVIVREDDHLTLINGADGTRLNESPLRREAIQPLADGDEIRIGNYVILVVESEKNQPFETTRLVMPAFPGVTTNSAAAGESEFTQTVENSPPIVHENSQDTVTPRNRIKPPPPPPSRNFAAVLDTLRTEEDSFYFTITDDGGARKTGRILLERAETPVGVDARNEIAFDIKQITALYAVARKDWSGILLESRRRNSVFVNGEAVEAQRRLRNDDRVSFSPPLKFVLVLHEPSLLVALEPLLSGGGVVAGSGANTNGGGQATAALTLAGGQTASSGAKSQVSLFERRYFGYFSFVETVTMLLGTMIAAVLFFLFFEFVFS